MPQADSRSFYFKVEGLKELQDGLERAGKNYKPVMANAMRNATTKLQNEARENIRKNGTTYQGNLAKSTRRRDPVTHERGVVAVGERYGGAVEFGRRPGKMPPVAPLERWAAVKLGQPGAGFVIARKIGRVGTRPQPFLEPALRDNADYVLRQFADAAEYLLREI